MGKPYPLGPKTVAFMAVMGRLKAAKDSGQGLSLKPHELDALFWGMGQVSKIAKDAINDQRSGG